MTIHTLTPNVATLHGCFARDLTPILIIDPGDTVHYETLDSSWITQFDPNLDINNPPLKRADLGKYFSPRESPRDDGHALVGPIAVRGARPGKMLSIHLNHIIPGDWGWVFPWFGTPLDQISNVPLLLWQLDADMMIGRNSYGHTVALNPFMGVMGMPVDEPGVQSTTPPRFTGGNIDCKELVAGSTLFLPVDVSGGLFSLGDGHATQGDGESGGTAIECPMRLVDVTFDLIDNPIINSAYAHTPKGWITFGFDTDLQVAHDMAQSAMQNFISLRYGVDRQTAMALMGVVVDMHITQTVNTVCGVHAILPHGVLRRYKLFFPHTNRITLCILRMTPS